MKVCFKEVSGIAQALTAMRLPYKSGSKSDSNGYEIGPKDYELSMKLIQAGPDHRKFLRLIDAWIEITAPLYWWKQFDTYRFGVEKVSESTMHCLMKEPIKVSCFEENLIGVPDKEKLLECLNQLREAGDFKTLNALLPQSYLQTRIVKCSYEALHTMYHARKSHKLSEWRKFCKVLEDLDFSSFITGEYDHQYARPKK